MRIQTRPGLKAPLLFAIAPFERSEDRIQQMVKTVEALKLWQSGDRDSSKVVSPILPVSIVSPADLSLPERLGAPMEDKVIDMAVASIDQTLERVLPAAQSEKREPIGRRTKSQSRKTAQIEFSRGTSRRQTAESLLDIAKRDRAELIAVSTHGRKGLERAWLGSFAETLVALSSVPVLTVNPRTQVPRTVHRILVPTDLTSAGHAAFSSLLKVAERFGAEVILYHIHRAPVPLFVDGGYPADAVALEALWLESERTQKEIGAAWAREAEKLGVRCRFVFSKEIGATAEILLKAAEREKADIIGLTSIRGPVSQAILGGSVREVLAMAERPVLVVHASQSKGKLKARKTSRRPMNGPRANGKKVKAKRTKLDRR